MKAVTVARKWRSIRSSHTSLRLISMVTLTICILLLMFSGIGRRKKYQLPLIDFSGAWQREPELIRYIQEALIWPPNWESFDLIDSEREDFSEFGQSKALSQIFNNLEGGFFIEARAGDGETNSISLYLERTLEWAGLLIEDDWKAYLNLTRKNRQSYSVHAKLAVTEIVDMNVFGINSTTELDPFEAEWDLPLYSLILAMQTKTINLLILDTTGTELEILQTVPWEDVNIEILCVAYTHLRGTPRVLTDYLSRQGYTLVQSHVQDLFFASNKFLGIHPQTEAQ